VSHLPKHQPSKQLPQQKKPWFQRTCWHMKKDLKVTATLNVTVQNLPLTLKSRLTKTKELKLASQMKRRTTKCRLMRMRMRTASTSWSTLKIWRGPVSECLAPSRASNKGTLTTRANPKSSQMCRKTQFTLKTCALLNPLPLNQPKLKKKEAPLQIQCIASSFLMSTKGTCKPKYSLRQCKSATASTDWRTSRTKPRHHWKR
jgi:hypothetical protein